MKQVWECQPRPSKSASASLTIAWIFSAVMPGGRAGSEKSTVAGSKPINRTRFIHPSLPQSSHVLAAVNSRAIQVTRPPCAYIPNFGRCTIYHPRGRAFMREISRRETLRKGMSLAGLLGLSDWALPALAQGESDVPFSDYPANFNAGGTGSPRRTFDIRTIDGFTVPKDKFFVLQHLNQPEIDPGSYRLKLSGMVNKPVELSLADLRKMRSTELVAAYECSGNSPRSFQS